MVVCYVSVDLQRRDWSLVAYNKVVEDMKCSMARQTFLQHYELVQCLRMDEQVVTMEGRLVDLV